MVQAYIAVLYTKFKAHKFIAILGHIIYRHQTLLSLAILLALQEVIITLTKLLIALCY